MSKKKSNQELINEAQEAYRQWLIIRPKLQEAQELIRQNASLMKTLRDFYAADYQRLYEAHEEGEALDLTTSGEYSVLSEDALWNAFHEDDELLWEIMRSSMKALDESRH